MHIQLGVYRLDFINFIYTCKLDCGTKQCDFQRGNLDFSEMVQGELFYRALVYHHCKENYVIKFYRIGFYILILVFLFTSQLRFQQSTFWLLQ